MGQVDQCIHLPHGGDSRRGNGALAGGKKVGFQAYLGEGAVEDGAGGQRPRESTQPGWGGRAKAAGTRPLLCGPVGEI